MDITCSCFQCFLFAFSIVRLNYASGPSVILHQASQTSQIHPVALFGSHFVWNFWLIDLIVNISHSGDSGSLTVLEHSEDLTTPTGQLPTGQQPAGAKQWLFPTLTLTLRVKHKLSTVSPKPTSLSICLSPEDITTLGLFTEVGH